MSRIDLLLKQSTIDIRNIEKHADKDFSARLLEYTEMVIKDVVQVICEAKIPFHEEGGREEILSDIELIYGISPE